MAWGDVEKTWKHPAATAIGAKWQLTKAVRLLSGKQLVGKRACVGTGDSSVELDEVAWDVGRKPVKEQAAGASGGGWRRGLAAVSIYPRTPKYSSSMPPMAKISLASIRVPFNFRRTSEPTVTRIGCSSEIWDT